MSLVFHYKEPISPTILEQGDGKYTLKKIPIFETHDREDIHCDDRWMRECVKNQQALREKGQRPRIIIGHTSDDPNAAERPCEAFLDNYQYDEKSGWLYADYVDVPQGLLDQIKDNKWPGRSAEASRSRAEIKVLALLGGNPPYFHLPDIRYSANAESFTIQSEIFMATKAKKINKAEVAKLFGQNVQKYAESAGLAGIVTKYADISGMSTQDPTFEETYREFLICMERWTEEAKAKQEGGGEMVASEPKAYGEDMPAKPEHEMPKEKEKEMKMSAQNQGEERVRYQELERKHTALLARVDELTEQNQRREDEMEQQKWTMKYHELRLPEGSIDVAKEVESLIALPASHRLKYFEGTTRWAGGPATEQIEREGGEKRPRLAAPGSPQETESIKKYHDRFRTHYSQAGGFGQAREDYRDGVTNPTVKK